MCTPPSKCSNSHQIYILIFEYLEMACSKFLSVNELHQLTGSPGRDSPLGPCGPGGPIEPGGPASPLGPIEPYNITQAGKQRSLIADKRTNAVLFTAQIQTTHINTGNGP